MNNEGILLLKDGTRFGGYLLNNCIGTGEVVFNTAMTGYQESLTDPSYCGQIVVMTYPLIGNYGVNNNYNQAERSFFRGYVVSQLCERPSNWNECGTIAGFVNQNDIPTIYGVDTRAVTRHIRKTGVMGGVIAPSDTPTDELQKLLNLESTNNEVESVTTRHVEHIRGNGKRLAIMDFGVKQAMLHRFINMSYDITLYPAFTPAEEVLATAPDGIFLSNGPGDPKSLTSVIENIKKFIASGKPLFGICLGCQLLALAAGADTYKMKFGHRGVNQPVKDLKLGKIFITSQNHGYAVNEGSLAGTGLYVNQRNINDGTVEGIAFTDKPIFAVQYHPEAHPGPDDHEYVFDRFADIMAEK
ncbi:glutamine-hydrolyzing carbamoyl-phosphate synthase small subunit [Deferribacterales bacterium RsTz2092]|nr:carbamoyl-phosphate synthase small chain [Deferribacterales bacterium]